MDWWMRIGSCQCANLTMWAAPAHPHSLARAFVFRTAKEDRRWRIEPFKATTCIYSWCGYLALEIHSQLTLCLKTVLPSRIYDIWSKNDKCTQGSAVRDWNELPEQTRNSPSLSIFKNRLKSNLITPPRYYNTGKRLGQIYHARLRTSCSPLRQHLHSKNIADSPYCTCGDIEDTHHFLFVCHRFTDLRRDLINSVSDICQPYLNVLLCGDISLTFGQNKQIFKAVQEFTIKSKRFEYTH